MPTQKISIYKEEHIINRIIERISDEMPKRNKELILAYDADNLRKGSSIRRRIKILNHLWMVCAWFSKPVDSVTKKDLEQTLEKLNTNEVIGRRGHPYSERTKLDCVEIFRQFAKWTFKKKLYAGRGKFDEVFEDFKYKMRTKKTDPTIITLDELKLLVENARTLQMKTALTVLFDSGARPEEFHNIRLEHVKWDDKKQRYLIYIEHPKWQSYKRTVDVPLCTELLRLYIETVKQQKNPSEQLFDLQYNYLRQYVSREGKKLLKKPITLYTFRHSSIQYYVEVYAGNVVHICQRYGWSYSTKMLQTYLNRSAVNLPDASELVHKDRLEEMEESKHKLEMELHAIQEKQHQTDYLLAKVLLAQQVDKKLLEKGIKKLPETMKKELAAMMKAGK